MAKLVLSAGGAVISQCFLDNERLTIGRDAPNQVVVDDPAVSREHAAITQVGNDHILEDLQSVNGTFVNGTRVLRHILQHGDVIELGAFRLRYLNPRASGEIDLDRTMLIGGLYETVAGVRQETGGSGEDEVRVPAARHTRVRFPKARVRILAGPRGGSTLELDRVVAAFGRPGDQLAVVTRRPQGYFLTHVIGRRRPRVNDQPAGKEPRLLHNGDVVEIADEKLEFLLD